MGNLDSRVTRAAAIYVGVVVLVVVAAQIGVFPGSLDLPMEGTGAFAHPYRLAMVGIVLLLAVSLGALAAWGGEVLGGWHLGLAALIVGGMATGTILAFAPSILYPNDQYPVTFSWVMLGAPVGFISWLACTVALRAAKRTVAA